MGDRYYTGDLTEEKLMEDVVVEKMSELSTVATTGDYDDLLNKPSIPSIPTNISSFTNDAGYLTQHQDISGKQNVLTAGDNITIQNNVISASGGTATTSYFTALSGNTSGGKADLLGVNNQPSESGIITIPDSIFGTTEGYTEITEDTTFTYTFSTPIQCSKLNGYTYSRITWKQDFQDGPNTKRCQVNGQINFSDGTNQGFGANPFDRECNDSVDFGTKAVSSIVLNVSLMDTSTRTEGTVSIGQVQIYTQTSTATSVTFKSGAIKLASGNGTVYTISQTPSAISISGLSDGTYDVVMNETQPYLLAHSMVLKQPNVPTSLLALPTMSSDGATIGGNEDSIAVNPAGYVEGHDAYKAFDGDSDTYWTSTVNNVALGRYTPTAKVIKRITITAEGITGAGIYYIPDMADWSNFYEHEWDNQLVPWVYADTKQTVSFDIDNNTPMKYVSLNFYNETTITNVKIYNITIEYESNVPANDTLWLDTSTEFNAKKVVNGAWVTSDDVPVGKISINSGVITKLETYPFANKQIDKPNNLMPVSIVETYATGQGNSGYILLSNGNYYQWGESGIQQNQTETHINYYKNLSKVTKILTLHNNQQGQPQNNITLYTGNSGPSQNVYDGLIVWSTQGDVGFDYMIFGKVV